MTFYLGTAIQSCYNSLFQMKTLLWNWVCFGIAKMQRERARERERERKRERERERESEREREREREREGERACSMLRQTAKN